MQFYLRIEGVNLGNFVYDVQDLSTVRGGSLLLLKAVDKVQELLKNDKIGLDLISGGASAGLWRFAAEHEKAAQDIRVKVEQGLAQDSIYRHATFVVDVLKVSNEKAFQQDLARLQALNRWRQMQSPSLAIPTGDGADNEICEVDLVRPAQHHDFIGGDRHWVSDSVHTRREYGKEQKQAFYRERTRLQNLPEFVSELEELSYHPLKGNLHHKIAVIYLDGNRFGAIQRDYCTHPKKQRGFDSKLRERRDDLLKGLLKEIIRDEDWISLWSGQPKCRIETLLWGGDEITWVVPAWKGWWTLKFFYQKTRDWKSNNIPLKHAAGLVFCHHNAPIHRITGLAKGLCDLAKAKGKQENYVAYQILESFDHTGEDLERFRQSRMPPDVGESAMIVPGDHMGQALEHIAGFKAEFPKRKLHAIVDKLLAGDSEAKALIEQTLKPLPEAQKALAGMQACFGDRRQPELWLHLLDLWDFID